MNKSSKTDASGEKATAKAHDLAKENDKRVIDDIHRSTGVDRAQVEADIIASGSANPTEQKNFSKKKIETFRATYLNPGAYKNKKTRK